MFNSAYRFMHSSKVKERLNIVNSAGQVVGWLDPWDGVFKTQLLVLENATKFLVFTIQSQVFGGKALLPSDIHEWLQPALAERKLDSGQWSHLRFDAAYVGKPHVHRNALYYTVAVDYQILYKVYPTKGLVYETGVTGQRQLGLLSTTKHYTKQETLHSNCKNLTVSNSQLRARFKLLLATRPSTVVVGNATIVHHGDSFLIQEF